jgi:hypothetical protein
MFVRSLQSMTRPAYVVYSLHPRSNIGRMYPLVPAMRTSLSSPDKDVRRNPRLWLPWVYETRFKELQPS